MAGGAPIPIPTSDPDEKILSIADLEKAASKKLGKSARGNTRSFVTLNFICCVHDVQPPGPLLAIEWEH